MPNRSCARRLLNRLTQTFMQSMLGTAMLHQVEDLRKYAANAPSFPVNQDRNEVRLYAAFVTVIALLLLAEPIFYISSVEESMVAKVAHVAPSVWCVLGAFGVSGILTLPHLFTLIFRPDLLAHRRFRVWATMGALLSSVTWMWMANLAVPMDVDGVEWPYGIRALVSLTIALIYGFSVNAQQLREARYAPNR